MQNPEMDNPCDTCEKTLTAGRFSLMKVRKFCFECPFGYVPSRFQTVQTLNGIRSCRRTPVAVEIASHSDAAQLLTAEV